jgi:hypothetical protein
VERDERVERDEHVARDGVERREDGGGYRVDLDSTGVNFISTIHMIQSNVTFETAT